jgi:short-subunit dehydrogenase
MEAAVAAGVDRFGRLDVAVANAGIASYGSVLRTDPAAFKRVLDINVLGVFHTARASLPALVESKGYFLVVSSLAAFAAAPGLAAYNASKAGAEHFANALRLEVKHQGVDVGCAHMSWIDTPLVRDAKKDLTTFSELISKLPYPLNRTASVDTCVDAFVRGIEKRSRHVYCPGWVRGVGLNRNVVNSAAGSRAVLPHVPDLLPRMDAEVAALGRSTSARNVANDSSPAAALDPKD